MNFIYEFHEIYTDILHLDQTRWEYMINKFINKLSSKHYGNLLITRLNNFISENYKIIITNINQNSNIIYPKIKINYKTVIITIPSVPYFINVDVIDNTILDNINIDDNNIINLYNISKGLQSNSIINLSKYKFLIKQENMPNFITFAHELIHCLRHFEGIKSNYEEEATIYGLNEYDITENMIRNEWGYNSRVSHNSTDIFCYKKESSYINSYKYHINDFYY
jgi:hypothetical protein